MMPFEEEQLKKASESILQYTEVLSATHNILRSDLLVASVWYCLKEEQKKVHRLEEALKIQSSESQKKPTETPKKVLTVTPVKDLKAITAPNKNTLSLSANVSNSVRSSQVVVVQPKSVVRKTDAKGTKDVTKDKSASGNKSKIDNSDQDVCVIEIDDDDDENDKPGNKKETTLSNKKETEAPKVKAPEPTKVISQNQKAFKGRGRPPKTLPAPVKKTDLDNKVERDKSKNLTKDVEETIILDEEDDIVEQGTSNTSDHEMFDMDCDEIQDESMKKGSLNKTTYKIIEPSEKAKASSILEEEEPPKESEEKEEETKSPRTRSKAKSEKENKQNDKKDTKDDKQGEIKVDNNHSINVIFEGSDDEAATEADDSKTRKETTPSKTPENKENDKTEKSPEKEQAPFPMTLTVAGQSDTAVSGTGQNQMNHNDSNNTQQFTTIVPNQFTQLTQQNVENPNVASDQFVVPIANSMESIVDNRQQYIQQPMNDTGILQGIKREAEVDVDQAVHGISPASVQGLMPIQGMHSMVTHQDMQGVPPHLAAHAQTMQGMPPPQGMPPSGAPGMELLQRLQGMVSPGQSMGPQPQTGFMYNPAFHHQGPPGFVNPQFTRQQFLPPHSNPVSLSSLTSGALTYPYSSTETTQQGMMLGPPGFMDPAIQQQLGLQQLPAQDQMQAQGRKRGQSGDNISPPMKKRLLDFDRKWHEGPTSSKGQERYIAPPSNASKSAQSAWNEGTSRITDMEWDMRFNSYQSISNHVPPKFVGDGTSHDIVQTEVVGVSLDDVGFHGHDESGVGNNTGEKGGDKLERGCFRGRGRRGRGAVRGRGAASRGGGTSGTEQRDSDKDNAGGGRKSVGSPGSPQKSGMFSFFKRGRQKVGRGRGGARGRGASTSPQGAKQTRGKVVRRGRGVKTRSKS